MVKMRRQMERERQEVPSDSMTRPCGGTSWPNLRAAPLAACMRRERMHCKAWGRTSALHFSTTPTSTPCMPSYSSHAPSGSMACKASQKILPVNHFMEDENAQIASRRRVASQCHNTSPACVHPAIFAPDCAHSVQCRTLPFCQVRASVDSLQPSRLWLWRRASMLSASTHCLQKRRY